jgi:glycosyltransferase involved in cell wall biosynthesis
MPGIKNVLMLTGLFPDEIRNEIIAKSKYNTQFAADALQWSFVKGLTNYYTNLHLVNFPFIGSYPTLYKTPFIKSFLFGKDKGFDGVNVGYFNLIALKNIIIYRQAKSNIRNWIKQTKGEKVILIYSAFLPFLKAAIAAKQEFAGLKVYLILPDLPQFMGGPDNALYRAFKKINNEQLYESFSQIDGFVLLSEFMTESLPIGAKPWTVIEGIFNDQPNAAPVPKAVSDKKIILYTGTLARRYGILRLLEAFGLIDDKNCLLVICGDGDTKEDINLAAEKDTRIIYKGSVDRAEVLKLQQQASLLINPRTAEGEFTKFSFPSKTMEYLASGVPTLLYELPGIPDEYYNYCYSLEDVSISALAKKITEILSLDPAVLAEKGRLAREFILNNKNPEKQCEKVYKLIEEIK